MSENIDLLNAWKLKHIELSGEDKLTTLDELYEAWKLDGELEKEGIYISEEDNKVLDLKEFQKKFKLNVIPMPFWGNLSKPKLIVLALNPSYNEIVDEVESSLFNETLKNVLKREEGLEKINWFDEKYNWKYVWSENIITPTRIDDIIDEQITKKEPESTYNWYQKVFKNLGVTKEYKEEMAFFNLLGYHSSGYENVPQKCFKNKNYQLLPTQKAMLAYLKILLKEDPFVIVIWGFDRKDGLDWKNVLKDNEINLNTIKLLIVNNNNHCNKIIINAIDKNKQNDFKEAFKKVVIDSEESSEKLKKFSNYK